VAESARIAKVEPLHELSVDSYVPYLLNRAALATVAHGNRLFRSAGLSVLKWRILFALWERGTCRFNALVKLTSSEPPTLSRVTNQLEGEGLLVRERVVSDTRLVDLSLSAKGRRAFERLIGPALETEKLLLDGIDPDDARTLKRCLAKIYDNARTAGETRERTR
jgi:DNA-binding MarR family transcriptional regulator